MLYNRYDFSKSIHMPLNIFYLGTKIAIGKPIVQLHKLLLISINAKLCTINRGVA